MRGECFIGCNGGGGRRGPSWEHNFARKKMCEKGKKKPGEEQRAKIPEPLFADRGPQIWVRGDRRIQGGGGSKNPFLGNRDQKGWGKGARDHKNLKTPKGPPK